MAVRNMEYVDTPADGQPFEKVYIENLPSEGGSEVEAATTEKAGVVKMAAHVDGESGTVANIVDALVAAGIMAAS